jgi:hypothetical protein
VRGLRQAAATGRGAAAAGQRGGVPGELPDLVTGASQARRRAGSAREELTGWPQAWLATVASPGQPGKIGNLGFQAAALQLAMIAA